MHNISNIVYFNSKKFTLLFLWSTYHFKGISLLLYFGGLHKLLLEYIRVAQSGPVKPSGQRHMKLPALATARHTPSFWHGGSQVSSSTWVRDLTTTCAIK